jgi:hypothetical protein
VSHTDIAVLDTDLTVDVTKSVAVAKFLLLHPRHAPKLDVEAVEKLPTIT